MKTRPIFLVDDDAGVLDAVGKLLAMAGYDVRPFVTAEALLSQTDPRQGHCLITDILLPGMDGIALLGEIRRQAPQLPVILITGHGDLPMAVQAVRAGAGDFIEKPFDDETLLGAVKRAVTYAIAQRRSTDQAAHAKRLLGALTAREKQVFDQLVLGQPNKVVAITLGISPRTTEAHRANILNKLGARSIADLVRLAIANEEPI